MARAGSLNPTCFRASERTFQALPEALHALVSLNFDAQLYRKPTRAREQHSRLGLTLAILQRWFLYVLVVPSWR